MNLKIKSEFKISAVLTLFLLSFLTLGINGTAIPSIELNVNLIKTEPVPLQTGEYADIWVKMRNQGELKASNASLELVPEFPFSADPDEDLTRNFGMVYPGEEYHAHFQIRVDENAVQGENELKFKVSGGEYTITHKVNVQIRTDDAALLVESVKTDPETISPSKTGKVSLKLKNLADSYLKNIDVSMGLSSSDIPLISVGSTTKKRIQKIEPGKTSTVSYNIKVDSDADPQAYKIPINLEYENEAGTSFTTEQYTGIIVGGKPELETNLIDSEILRPGETGEVSLSIFNRGLTLAKFLSLEVEQGDSYEIISSPEVYIGNMDSDDYESATFKIYVKEGVKEVDIPLKLKYKDSEGNSEVETQTASFKTYNEEEIDQMQLVKHNNTWMYAIVAVIILVAIYVGYRYWKSKKKKILEE